MHKDIKNIAVLISGGGTNLQALIDSIQEGNINGEIKLVISNKKDAYGLERAKFAGIKSLYLSAKGLTNEEYDEKILELLENEDIDLIVLAGYLKILSKNLISKYRNRIINIHPSLIPSFCGDGFYGIGVHEKALEYGVKITGATTHFVTEETDGGPIILQKSVPVRDADTAEDLQKRVLSVEYDILVESVKLFCEDKIEVIGRRTKIKESLWKREH